MAANSHIATDQSWTSCASPIQGQNHLHFVWGSRLGVQGMGSVRREQSSHEPSGPEPWRGGARRNVRVH